MKRNGLFQWTIIVVTVSMKRVHLVSCQKAVFASEKFVKDLHMSLFFQRQARHETAWFLDKTYDANKIATKIHFQTNQACVTLFASLQIPIYILFTGGLFFPFTRDRTFIAIHVLYHLQASMLSFCDFYDGTVGTDAVSSRVLHWARAIYCTMAFGWTSHARQRTDTGRQTACTTRCFTV